MVNTRVWIFHDGHWRIAAEYQLNILSAPVQRINNNMISRNDVVPSLTQQSQSIRHNQKTGLMSANTAIHMQAFPGNCQHHKNAFDAHASDVLPKKRMHAPR